MDAKVGAEMAALYPFQARGQEVFGGTDVYNDERIRFAHPLDSTHSNDMRLQTVVLLMP